MLTAAAIGACITTAMNTLLRRAVLVKLRRDIRALNAGDYRPVLSGFAENAVLRFNEGEHRWSGEHRGREAIARFLRNYVAARMQGEIRELHLSGPLWRLTLIARFDDHAHDPAGNELYRNRVVLFAHTRWGRVVHHEDFYEDTQRIAVLETRLRELGIQPVD